MAVSEKDWLAGNRAAYNSILKECLSKLGVVPSVEIAAELVEGKAALVRLLNEIDRYANASQEDHLSDLVRALEKRICG
jgi:hypothetical protein